MARRYVHVVLGGDVLLAAYGRIDLAIRHARCVTGADVVSMEVLDELPEEIKGDLELEWELDDDTPVIAVDDIDDPG